MRLIPAICLLSLTICSSTLNATDGDRPTEPAALVSLDQVAPIPSNAAAERPEPKGVPGFFGYLEFDFDPDAPGGVPGFGPISPPAQMITQTSRD
jgi:hypothetical protein